jgi:purine-binding chemotaxis protein CheW
MARKKTPNILGELLKRAPGVSEAGDTAATETASQPVKESAARRAKKPSASKPKEPEMVETTKRAAAKPARAKEPSSDRPGGLDAAPAEPGELGVGAPVRFVGFRLDRRLYALPLDHVERVLRMVAVTPVPEAPSWVAGVIDLQGRVITVVDLRRRFEQATREARVDDRLLIVRVEGRTMALMVDEVTEVLELPAQQVKPSSELMPDARPLSAVIRRNGDLILVLDAARLLPPRRKTAKK